MHSGRLYSLDKSDFLAYSLLTLLPHNQDLVRLENTSVSACMRLLLYNEMSSVS